MGTPERREEHETIGARLRAVRHRLDLSQAELAAQVGITQGTVASYEADRRDPPTPTLLALEHALHINHQWLLDGAGEPLTGVRPGKPAIVTDPSELNRLEQLEGQDQYYVVPYLRDPAAAGEGLIMEEQVEGYCIIHRRVAPRPEVIRCVRISGHSMAPTLTDGSIVAVDISPLPLRVLEGKIVCCRTSDAAVVIKRLRLRGRYALLFSDSEDQRRYPPIVVDMREVQEPVIGQVIWGWVDLR